MTGRFATTLPRLSGNGGDKDQPRASLLLLGIALESPAHSVFRIRLDSAGLVAAAV